MKKRLGVNSSHRLSEASPTWYVFASGLSPSTNIPISLSLSNASVTSKSMTSPVMLLRLSRRARYSSTLLSSRFLLRWYMSKKELPSNHKDFFYNLSGEYLDMGLGFARPCHRKKYARSVSLSSCSRASSKTADNTPLLLAILWVM